MCSSLHVRTAIPPHRGNVAEAAGAAPPPPPPARVAQLAVAAAEAHPAAASAAQRAMDTALQQEEVHVDVQHIPARQGTLAPRERCERRACGGNRPGAECRRRHGLAMPAAIAAAASIAPAYILSEGSDGDGGAAPRKRPWVGRSEHHGQRRRVAVVRPAGPPPRTPNSGLSTPKTAPFGRSTWATGAGGYAADQSSPADDWS